MDEFSSNRDLKCSLGQMLELMPWTASLAIICLTVILFGCRASESDLPDRWETYHNSRYGFEFPYPAGWQSSILPENRDGMAFRDPRNSGVEIRGWASFLRSPKDAGKLLKKSETVSGMSKDSGTAVKPRKGQSFSGSNNPISTNSMPANFTTEQGIQGTLRAKLEAQTSSLTLVLHDGAVQYYWQGSAPSQQFDAYYRFFNYIARHYKVPKNKIPKKS
jgi:hypothetical protein